MICIRSQGLGYISNSDNSDCAAFFHTTPYFKKGILMCVFCTSGGCCIGRENIAMRTTSNKKSPGTYDQIFSIQVAESLVTVLYI